jgi:electron transfer flavoprotein-quinone oxidoreductase
MKRYDAIVVGAGPAGTTAALRMAGEGLRVLLLERGEFPGAKNMFGGILHNCPVLNDLFTDFWDQAPWERYVIRRVLTLMTQESSTSLAFETDKFDRPPYNGYTLFRPVFDRWYAERAQEAGAKLLCGCAVEDLLWKDKAVSGVRVGRDHGDVQGQIVIACDGALSFLAQKAGMRKEFIPSQMALGIRALFRLKEELVNERFNLVRRQGASHEFIGCTEGVRGGGFIYTQTDGLSVGLVLCLDSLKKSQIAPYELFERFIALDQLQKLLRGGKLLEYSAHLLPEGGYRMVPDLFTDGMLVAGDAAALCYTNLLNQEGMNLAITSGFLAAETAIEAFARGDFSSRQLSQYRERLQESFVLKDMRTFEKAVHWMGNDRLFSVYPNLVATVMEQVFRSDGSPREKIGRLGWNALRDTMPIRHLIADLMKGGRFLV